MKYLFKLLILVLLLSPFFVIAADSKGFIVCDPTSNNDCNFSGLVLLINNVINFALILGTSIFSIVFMYAGYLYLTALGNTGQISKAHGLFWNAIIGFVIMLAAWLFVDFILVNLLKGDNLDDYRLLSK